MIIKQVSQGTVDVFWNTGWDSWARMSTEHASKGSWKLVKGEKMPRRVFGEFRNRMTRQKGRKNAGNSTK